MVTKILKAVQSTQAKYPDALQTAVDSVKKALSWLNRQPFGGEVKELFKRLSFTVDFGGFPELGVQKFSVTKKSGDTTVYGATERNSGFALDIDGFVRSAQQKAQAKRGDAKQKADAARVAADNARKAAEEAQRLSLEAARLAEQAEAEADTFENAIGHFSSVR